MVKALPLQNKIGLVTLVDDDVYEWASGMQWCAHETRDGRYEVRASFGKGSPWPGARLHRLIMGVWDPRICVDHIDGNPLNNQRSNLRIANITQNNWNARKRRTNCGKEPASKYKGVVWDARKQKWRVRFWANGQYIQVGRFKDEEEAARAYNEVARRIAGEFARINKVPGEPDRSKERWNDVIKRVLTEIEQGA